MTFLKSQILAFMLLMPLAFALIGCENEDIQAWKNETTQLRIAAERQIASVPYRREQHLAFKSYFTSLATMALSLQQDAGKRQRFNEAVSRAGVGELCRDVFIVGARWQQLMESCTKNRFFLCAEEVRAYPTFHRALRGTLRADLARRFDGAAQCQEPRP